MSRAELHQLWGSLDIDGLGAIDFAEFTATLFPDHVRRPHDASFVRKGQDTRESTSSDASDDGAVGAATNGAAAPSAAATTAVEARLLRVEAQLASMHSMMQSVHDGVHRMAKRTVVIEQSFGAPKVTKDRGQPSQLVGQASGCLCAPS